MNTMTLLGIDIGKHSFHLQGSGPHHREIRTACADRNPYQK
jgi:hypothetical protein